MHWCTPENVLCTSTLRVNALVYTEECPVHVQPRHNLRFPKSLQIWGSLSFALSSMAVGKNPPVNFAPSPPLGFLWYMVRE